VDDTNSKAKLSYFIGCMTIISGILMGSAGTIWATRLTDDYSIGLVFNQRNSLDTGTISTRKLFAVKPDF